jgi:Rrf2 family protein
MSILSKSCVYGLRATLYVASFDADRKFVPIREVAEELQISFHFLTKILQQLTEAGLMESYRGPNGGIALAGDAAKKSLLDVVKAIDGDSIFQTCILGLADCSDKHPCPLHGVWGTQRKQLFNALKKTSLGDLRGPLMRKELRLRDAANPAKSRRT